MDFAPKLSLLSMLGTMNHLATTQRQLGKRRSLLVRHRCGYINICASTTYYRPSSGPWQANSVIRFSGSRCSMRLVRVALLVGRHLSDDTAELRPPGIADLNTIATVTRWMSTAAWPRVKLPPTRPGKSLEIVTEALSYCVRPFPCLDDNFRAEMRPRLPPFLSRHSRT